MHHRPVRRVPIVIAGALLALCFAAAASATMNAVPSATTAVQGGTSAPIQLGIFGAINVDQDPVNLIFTGLPAGVTTAPAPVTAIFSNDTTGAASFRFAVAPGTAPGVYPITIAGPGQYGIGSVGVQLTIPVPGVSVQPVTVSVQAGQTSPSVTVTVTNVTNQSLAFAATLPAALAGNTTVQPSPVVVTVPNGPTSGNGTFAFATTAATPPGSYPIAFQDPVSGLGFSLTLQVTAAPPPPPPPAALDVQPAQVTVGQDEIGPAVTLTLSGAPAGTYPLSVQLPGALAGNVSVEPAPVIVVGTNGTPSSAVVRLRTTAASPAGDFTVRFGHTGLGVSGELALRIRAAQGSATIAPGSVALAPGRTSEPLTLRVAGSGLGGRTFEFRPAGGGDLGVQPSPVRVAVPVGAGQAMASFRVAVPAGASPGSVRLVLREPQLGLEAVVTVVIEDPRATVTLSPPRVVVGPGVTSEPVTLRVADSNLAGRTLTFRLADPGAAHGLSLVPAAVVLAVPAGGAPATAPLRVAAGPAAAPGVYPLTLAADGLPGLSSVLTVEVESPVVIDRLEPRALAQGTVDARVRLVGRGFVHGARAESSSPLLAVRGTRVISPTLAEARVSVRRDAPVGVYALDLVNPAGGRSRTSALLAVVDRGALTAPVGVETLAIVHPAPGAAVALDDAIYPRGLIATTGTGALVGSWRLDGVPFDRFVVTARGGEPVEVAARLPLPRSALGRHRLELAVESPVELVAEPVELLQVVGRASRLILHAPPEGAVVRAGELELRWSAVPGAAGFEVEVLREGERPLAFRVPEAHWRPSARELAAIGPGLRRWRVRPVFAGGVEGEATEPRRLSLLPDSVEPVLRPAELDPATGSWRLSWDAAGQGILYRVEVWGEPEEDGGPAEGSRPLYVALTAETSYALPAGAEWARRARSWRLVALGPGGVVLGVSERAPLPAGATGAAGPGRGPRSGGAGSRARFAFASAAALESARSVVPAPPAGAEVATAYPRIAATWEPGLAPEEVELRLDGTDVTAVSTIGPTSAVYESLLPLVPGEHRVELRLGGTETGWTFSIVEGAAAEVPAGEAPAGETGAGEAWIAAPVAGAAPASTVAGRSRGWADWRLGAEGTLTRVTADDLEDDESTGSALVSGQVDYRDEGGGGEPAGAFAKGTGDVGVTETFEGASEDLETRSWVLGAGLEQRRTRQEIAFGYSSPDFLFGSELLSDGLPQGGGQATAALGPAALSYYRTFDPDFGGSLSGAFGPDLELQAGALTLADSSGRLQLRAVGLETEEDGDGFDPGGEGSVIGLFTSFALSPAVSLVLEGARGDFTPAPGDFGLGEERSGNAFRLGATGSREWWSWNLGLRYAEAGFVNPAARGLTAGVLADRAGADLAVTRSFAGGASLGIELRHLQGGTDSGLDSSDARQDGGVVRWSSRFGERVGLMLSGSYMSTRGGGDAELGLPETDQTDRGAQLSLDQTWGRVSFTQSFTWHDTEDANDPFRANELLNASLTANATFSPAFSLFGQLDGLRNESGGPFGGVTDTLLACLQPTWNLSRLGLTVQPYAAYNRLESDFAEGATETEAYRMLLSWAPPRIGGYLSLQAGADWSRTSMPGLPDPGLTARYTASVTLRWDGAGQTAAPAAPPEYALLPGPEQQRRAILDRLAGVPDGVRLAGWL